MSGGKSVQYPYMPSGQGSADMNFQNLFNGQMPWAQGAAGNIIPNLYGAAWGVQNNPYIGQMQAGANAASQYGTGTLAPQMQAGATNLFGAGSQLAGAIPGVQAYANDPQNMLYNQTVGQTTDQQNAINAMSGVSGSPYGAGIQAQNLQNFNLGWGNNQLGRMATGASTASGLAGGAAGAYGAGSNLGTGAMQTQAGAAALPYQAANVPYMADMSAWNQAAGGVNSALAPSNALMNELATYMGIGQNATSTYNQAQNQQWQQDNAIWQGLGQLFGQGAGASMMPGWNLGQGQGMGNFWQMLGL